MASFKDQVLDELRNCCRDVYTARSQRVRQQQRVSDTARQAWADIMRQYDAFTQREPFPGEPEVDVDTLRELARRLRAAEVDADVAQEQLLAWVRGHQSGSAPATAATTTAPGPPLTVPDADRMLENLHAFKLGITRARLRLRAAGDTPDRAAYTAARNAYTLASSTYQSRLQNGQLAVGLADNLLFEDEILPPLGRTDGAAFPGVIDAATQFIDARLFAPPEDAPA